MRTASPASPLPSFLDSAHVVRLGDDLVAWVQAHPLWRKQEGIPTTRLRARAVLAELLNAAAVEAGCGPLPGSPFDRLALVELDGMPTGRVEALAADAGVWLWGVLQHPDARQKVSTLFSCWPADWRVQVAAARSVHQARLEQHAPLTDVELSALKAVWRGADVFDYGLAQRLRALEAAHPQLVVCTEPRGKYPARGRIPYLGASATAAGRARLAAAVRVRGAA